jgi:hypothetical protein
MNQQRPHPTYPLLTLTDDDCGSLLSEDNVPSPFDDFDEEELGKKELQAILEEQRRVEGLTLGQLVDEFCSDWCSDQVIQLLLMKFHLPWVLELAGNDGPLKERVLCHSDIEYQGRDFMPES